MVTRKISKRKYLLAAVLTFLIFSLGLSLGVILDNIRLQQVEFDNRVQEVDYASLQMQYVYLTSLEQDEENCVVLRQALENNVLELGESLDEFLEFKKQTTLNKDQYRLAHRKYLIDNIRYWFFATRTKERCDMDLSTILYFYSGKSCDDCPDQGFILTFFKNVYDERLLIFPLDTDVAEDEPLVAILMSKYGISTYPSIVLADKKYEGLVPKEILNDLICESFSNSTSCK